MALRDLFRSRRSTPLPCAEGGDVHNWLMVRVGDHECEWDICMCYGADCLDCPEEKLISNGMKKGDA